MKGYTKDQLRYMLGDVDLEHSSTHCLKCLYADKKHTLNEEVVKGLTFEELIACLHEAEDVGWEAGRENLR